MATDSTLLQGTFTVPFFTPGTGIFFVDGSTIDPDGFQQVIPLTDPDGDGPLNALEFTIAGTTFTENDAIAAPTAVFNGGELAGITFAPSPLLGTPFPPPFTGISIAQTLATATTPFGPFEATVEYGPLTAPEPEAVFVSSFTVEGGLLDGEQGTITYDFDESQIPPAGSTGTVNIQLDAFELTLAGETLTLADDADGANVQYEGAQFNGFDFATSNVPATNSFFSLSFEVGPNGPGFGSFALLDNAFTLVNVAFAEPVRVVEGSTPIAEDDSFTTDEDTVLSGDVAANDCPADHDAATYSVVDDVSNGTLNLAADGSFTFSPVGAFDSLAVGDTATEAFTYSLTDDNGTATATATITIDGVNDAPVADDDAAATAFETAVAIDVLDGDTDVDAGDVLTIDAVGAAANGTTEIVGGQVVYTPNAGFADATDSFTYTVSDGNGGIDTATVTVTVGPAPNLPPVAGDDTATTDEDNAVAIDVLANDVDPDGDALTVAIDTASGNGSATANPDGTVTFDPSGAFESLAVGATATEAFTYTVNDGEFTDTATVTVTITGVNDAPVADDDAATTEFETPVTIDVLDGDTDVDAGDVLSIDAVGTAANGTTEVVGGQVVYTPDAGFEGTDTFEYTVSDGNGGADTATVTVTVSDDPNPPQPPVAGDDTATTDEDTAVAIAVLANDTDPNPEDVLSVVAVDSDAAAINADGTVTFDPNGAFESLAVGASDTATFGYTVSDPSGLTDSATVTVTITGVNDAPVADDDVAITEFETPVTIDVLDGDTDVDAGDVLSIDAVGTAANGTTEVVGGQVVYTPDAGFEGTDTFEYTVSDGNGGADTATVTVTVSDDPNPPQPPVAGDDTATTDEDTAVAIAVLANDTDPNPEDVLSVVAVDSDAAAINADGTVTFDPNGAFESLAVGASDTATFGYTVSDPSGLTDSATVTVTITGVNDAPVADDDAAITEFETSVTIDVLDGDTDVDAGDVLSIDAVGTAANGTTEIVGGQVVYTPDAGFEGTDTFEYTVSDGNGGADTATVTVTISDDPNPPQPPVAGDDTATTDEDTAVAIAVLANDTDPNPEDVLSVVAVDSDAAAINADGTVTFDPNGAFESLAVGASDTATFGYTVSDPSGLTDSATVTVTITGVNDAPVADDDAAITEFETPVTIDVLDGDTDVDAGDVLSIDAVGTAANGTTEVVGGQVVYTPDAGFEGTDTFEYTVSDGNGGADTATVTVTISDDPNPAQPPVAGDDTATTDEDTAVAIAVLANDTDPNPEDVLSVVAVDSDAAAINADGTVTFDPNGAFESLAVGASDTATFGYTVSDPGGLTDSATVTVTITGVNDAPVADDDAAITEFETPVTIDVLDGDTDVDAGDVLSIDAVGTAANGTTEIVGGQVVYTPDAGFEGTDTFEYTVSDGNGGADTATVTVEVEPDDILPMPETVDFDFIVAEGDLLGEVGDVSITYDAALIDASSAQQNIPLDAITFNLAGQTLTLTDDADGANVQFENGVFNGTDFAVTTIPVNDTFISVSFEVGANGDDIGSFALIDNNFQVIDVELFDEALFVSETFNDITVPGGVLEGETGSVSIFYDELLVDDTSAQQNIPLAAIDFTLAGEDLTLADDADGANVQFENGAFNGTDYAVTTIPVNDTFISVSFEVGANGDDVGSFALVDNNFQVTDVELVPVVVEPMLETVDFDFIVAEGDLLGEVGDVSITYDKNLIDASSAQQNIPAVDVTFTLGGETLTLTDDADGANVQFENGVFNGTDFAVTTIPVNDTFISVSFEVGANGDDIGSFALVDNNFQVIDVELFDEALFVSETFNDITVPGGALEGETGSVSIFYDELLVDDTSAQQNIPLAAIDFTLAGEDLTLADDADGANVQFENGAFNGTDYAVTTIPVNDTFISVSFEVGANGDDVGSFALVDNNFQVTDVELVPVVVEPMLETVDFDFIVAEGDLLGEVGDVSITYDKNLIDASSAQQNIPAVDVTFTLGGETLTLTDDADGANVQFENGVFNGTDFAVTTIPVNDTFISVSFEVGANGDDIGSFALVDNNFQVIDVELFDEALFVSETFNDITVPGGALEGETGSVSIFYDELLVDDTSAQQNIPLAAIDFTLAGEDLTLADDADGANVQFENGAFNGTDYAVTTIPVNDTFISVSFEVGANGDDVGSFALVDNNFQVTDVELVPPVADDAPFDVFLIDADTDEIITEIENGDIVDEDLVFDRNVTLVAFIPEESPLFGEVGSVRLNLNGGQEIQRENVEPYALFGDSGNGNFFGGDLELPLENNLVLDAFSGRNLNGDQLDSVAINFILQNGPIIEPPVTTNDAITVAESETAGDIDINVLDNDVSGTGDALAVVTVVNNSPTLIGVPTAGLNGGLFTVNADGTVDFDANGDFEFLAVGETAETSIQFGVGYADLADGPVTGSQLVVTVEGENDSPVANDDTAILVGESVVIDVLNNDLDPDTTDVLEVTDFTEPASGSVVLEEGVLVYTANDSFVDSDSFEYTIADGNGGTDTATVTVTGDPTGVDLVTVGLFDADTDTLIGEIREGSVFEVTPGQSLTISVSVETDDQLFGQDESVFLDLNNGDTTRRENAAPYALFGDNGRGNLRGGSIPTGANTIDLDVFSQNNLNGDQLADLTFNFTLVETA